MGSPTGIGNLPQQILQRKMALRVSGDRVSGLTGPFYEVPEEWTRHRDVLKKSLRNSVREYVGGFALVALFVFFFVQFVILLRHRYAGREDIKRAFYWTLAIGVLPSLLVAANGMPSFFHEYYYRTEASISAYTTSEALRLTAHFIWMPAAMLFLFLFVGMIVCAWLPEQGDLGRMVATLRPARWGSFDNRWGVLLGLAMAAFSSGLGTMEGSARALFSPDLFSPSAAFAQISVNQVSEILNLAGNVTQLVLLCLGLLIVVGALKRFVKKESLILTILVALTFLATDGGSLSWRTLLLEWGLSTASLLISYWAVTRVLRWNIMAYVVWVWVDLNAVAFSNFKRFALSASPEFFRPSIEQMAALVLPVAVVVAYGFFKGGNTDQETN